jgi:hypothetical protein
MYWGWSPSPSGKGIIVLPTMNYIYVHKAKPVKFCTIDTTAHTQLLRPILLLFYRNFGVSSLQMV